MTQDPKIQLGLRIGSPIRLPGAPAEAGYARLKTGIVTELDTEHATVRLETGRQVRYEIDRLLGRR